MTSKPRRFRKSSDVAAHHSKGAPAGAPFLHRRRASCASSLAIRLCRRVIAAVKSAVVQRCPMCCGQFRSSAFTSMISSRSARARDLSSSGDPLGGRVQRMPGAPASTLPCGEICVTSHPISPAPARWRCTRPVARMRCGAWMAPCRTWKCVAGHGCGPLAASRPVWVRQCGACVSGSHVGNQCRCCGEVDRQFVVPCNRLVTVLSPIVTITSTRFSTVQPAAKKASTRV